MVRSDSAKKGLPLSKPVVSKATLNIAAVVLALAACGSAFVLARTLQQVWSRETTPLLDKVYEVLEKPEVLKERSQNSDIEPEEIDRFFASPTLWDPATSLPSTHRLPLVALEALFRYQTTCESKNINGNQAELEGVPALKKALVWARYHCNRHAGATLPAGYFLEPPYVHPSGVSFAQLGLEAGISTTAAKFFLLQELPGIAELKAGSSSPSVLPKSVVRVGALSLEAQAALWRRAEAFATGDLVIVAQPGKSRYRTYNRAKLSASLEAIGLKIETRQEAIRCSVAWGEVCVSQRDPVSQAQAIMTLVWAAICVLATSLLLLLAGAVMWTLQTQAARRERLLVMQILAHEVRTPVAAIQMVLEELRPEYDALSDAGKDAFFGLLAGVQRLGRVVDASSVYLKTNERLSFLAEGTGKPEPHIGSAPRSPHVTPSGVTSLQDCLFQVAQEFNQDIVFEDLECDIALPVQPFWLTLCVRNLLRNALVHGKKPVVLKALVTSKNVHIFVEDSGTGAIPQLTTLVRPFHKGGTSEGLGLGLAIVSKVVSGMRGSLRLGQNPTRFEIIFNRGKHASHSGR